MIALFTHYLTDWLTDLLTVWWVTDLMIGDCLPAWLTDQFADLMVPDQVTDYFIVVETDW